MRMYEKVANASKYVSIDQLMRYGIVGGLLNLVAYVCFLYITFLGMEPKVAMTIIYLVFAAVGFWGHKHLTFSHKGPDRKSALKYLLAHVSAYLINLLILYYLFNVLGYSYKLVQAGSMLFVAGFLFVTFKYVVFRAPD